MLQNWITQSDFGPPSSCERWCACACMHACVVCVLRACVCVCVHVSVCVCDALHTAETGVISKLTVFTKPKVNIRQCISNCQVISYAYLSVQHWQYHLITNTQPHIHTRVHMHTQKCFTRTVVPGSYQ